MATKYPSIQVINRASSLLDAITRDEQPVSLKVLAADTGLHPATAFRILGAMASNGLTQRDSRGRYRIGAQLSAINAQADLSIHFCRASQEAMEQARARHQCEVVLGTRDRDFFIPVIEIGKQPAAVTADQPQHHVEGQLLHETGAGRLMLGNAGRRTFERYVRRARCDDRGQDVSETSLVDKLWARIERELVQGFAIDNVDNQSAITFSALVNPDDTWRCVSVGMTYATQDTTFLGETQASDAIKELSAQIDRIDAQTNDLRPSFSAADQSQPIPATLSSAHSSAAAPKRFGSNPSY